jgi:hypothetical protein
MVVRVATVLTPTKIPGTPPGINNRRNLLIKTKKKQKKQKKQNKTHRGGTPMNSEGN